MGSPLGGAIAPGGSGGGITESQLRTAAAALTASLDVNGQKIIDLATPTAATDAATKGYVDGQITDLIYDQGGSAGGRVYTSLASAVTAAASIPGKVRIWIRTTSGTPTTTGVTYALANRIELCGLQSTQKTTLAMVASAVFQDACAFRNLAIETDLGAAWLTSADTLSVVFDNTAIVDNGATAAVATLGAGFNYFTFDNGASFNNGGTMPLCALSSGRTVLLEMRDGTISDNTITGSAGNLYVYEGGSGNYTVQSGFSGSIVAYDQKVVSQLGRAATAVSVNGQRVTNVAVPTASTDAAPRGWVDGSASVALGSTSVSLTAANVATGHVTLTGALSGNTTATLPTGARAVWLTNATTGTYALRIAGFSGGFCYLLPGQTKRLIQGADNVIRGEGLGVLEVSHTLSLVGISGGDTLHSYRLPAGTVLERCEIVGLVDPDGNGDYSASAGFAADLGEDYSDVVSFALVPAAGTVRGLASADWGSAFTDGYSYDASARTLVFRINAFNQTVAPTVGKLRIHVVARYLGE